jgi:hypothetical protein
MCQSGPERIVSPGNRPARFPIQQPVRSSPTLAGRLRVWGLVFRVRRGLRLSTSRLLNSYVQRSRATGGNARDCNTIAIFCQQCRPPALGCLSAAPGRGRGLQTQRHVSPKVAAGAEHVVRRPVVHGLFQCRRARNVSVVSTKRGSSLDRGAPNAMPSLRRITTPPLTGLVVGVRRPASPKRQSPQDNERTA